MHVSPCECLVKIRSLTNLLWIHMYFEHPLLLSDAINYKMRLILFCMSLTLSYMYFSNTFGASKYNGVQIVKFLSFGN